MPIYKSMPFAASVFALALSGQTAVADDVVINLGYAAAEGSSYAVLANKFEELTLALDSRKPCRLQPACIC